MRQPDFTLDFLVIERLSFPFIRALWEAWKENLGIQFIEGGFRALEEQFGHTLTLQAGLDLDMGGIKVNPFMYPAYTATIAGSAYW